LIFFGVKQALICYDSFMTNFVSYDRSQQMLLPPGLREWVGDDDLAHFIVEAAEHVEMHAFHIVRLTKSFRVPNERV